MAPDSTSDRADYAIVGGGLQAGLIALAVRAHQPAARIAIVERAPALAGNHTWCFHAGDLPPDADWIDPLVVHRWPGYDVAFPGQRRTLASPYAAVTNERLAGCVAETVDVLWLGEPAIEIAAERVVTPSRALAAEVVIDARGPGRLPVTRTGWQVFVGLEVIVPGHGVERPIVMDAVVEQLGGFRFMYVLPLAPDRLLVEDTVFADRPVLAVEAHRAAIRAYAQHRGWAIERVVREETGCIPLPLELDPPRVASPLVAGYAGSWFHPVTGYSFPIAARLADAIARTPAGSLFDRDGALAELARSHTSQLAFATRLNRMLFGWFAPEDRHHVLARFYRLPEPVIRRFYALELTRLDRARFFFGRPPRGLSWRAALGGELA
ncbi:MAG TPA: lycopene beta-cyclase CrtY [Kofleriaceae bacterium]|nr:lycopene beta-cyclase CrtY [Kofleriaceae bacterium]